MYFYFFQKEEISVCKGLQWEDSRKEVIVFRVLKVRDDFIYDEVKDIGKSQSS